MKKVEKKVEEITKKIEKEKPKEQYGGMKKGFLSGGGSSQSKPAPKIAEVKAPAKKSNPL